MAAFSLSTQITAVVDVMTRPSGRAAISGACPFFCAKSNGLATVPFRKSAMRVRGVTGRYLT